MHFAPESPSGFAIFGETKRTRRTTLPTLTKKLITLLSIIGLAAMLSACESGSSTTGGGTTEARTISLDGKTSSSTDDDTATTTTDNSAALLESEEQEFTSTKSSKARGNVNLTFRQTAQPCSSCGIWFDSMKLVVEHSSGTYTSPTKTGRLLIKKSSGLQQSFAANLSSIPAGATIQRATLYMKLNSHEGLAGSDNGSVLSVSDGGKHVRNITASGDMKGRGYSKSNPNVPIDFTAYVKGL